MFASGDEDLRSELYDQFGDALITDFRSIQKRLRELLNEWNEDEEQVSLSDKQVKNLLIMNLWKISRRLLQQI